MAKRVAVPPEVQARVLTRCRRRCCLCYFVAGKTEEVAGQIAHIDKNPANPDISNLVFLCLDHHDEYDSSTSVSKNYTPQEVCHYRSLLDAKFGHNHQVLSLISKVSDTTSLLSIELPSVVKFARDGGFDELLRVCKVYLSGKESGITSGPVSLSDAPSFVLSRSPVFYCPLGQEVNPAAVTTGSLSPETILAIVRSSKLVREYRLFMELSVLEIEQQVAKSNAIGLLTHKMPMKKFFLDNPNLGNDGEVVYGYALSTIYSDMITSIRSDLISRLNDLV